MKKIKDTIPIPLITSESWCVCDVDTGCNLLTGKLVN
jgi:hypothetical protein